MCEFYAREPEFEVGGHRIYPWRRQEAPDEVLGSTLVETSWEACLRQRLWYTPQGETYRVREGKCAPTTDIQGGDMREQKDYGARSRTVVMRSIQTGILIQNEGDGQHPGERRTPWEIRLKRGYFSIIRQEEKGRHN